MHDGECPRCHTLHDSREMTKVIEHAHRCPTCLLVITEEESAAVMKEFAAVMERNFAVFEAWRASRQ